MELELSLKITKVRDDLTSVAELWLAKDHGGPLFFSTETDSNFILTAHLKGLSREKIKIEINEDGTRIVIRGEKQVEEMVMAGGRIHKKEVEKREFRKVFRIPDGVVLDRIKAKFNEDEAILSIVMPKSIKGVRGIGIEEVKADEIPKQETIKMANEQESKKPDKQEIDRVVEKSPPEAPENEHERGKETEKTTTTTVTHPETAMKEGKQVEAERTFGQSEKTELPPPEKTQSEKLPDSKEKAKKEDIQEAESKKPKEVLDEIQQSQVEEEHTKGEPRAESKMSLQESQKEVEREREHGQSEKTDMPPPEKPRAEELSGLKDKIAEAERSKKSEGRSEQHERSPETFESTEVPDKASTQQSQVEEEHTKGESPRVESETPQGESEKHESKTDIQDPEKLKPDHERGQTATPLADHPADQENGIEEVHGQEEGHGVGKQIQEAATDQQKLPAGKEVQNHESSKVEKQKGTIDEATPKKRTPPSEKSRLFAPRFVAGSAFLVSLLVLVIHLIRAKKG